MHRRKCLKALCLFCIGGGLYVLLELLWRRRSHWVMFAVGGVCFHAIGVIYRKFSRFHLLIKCALSALAVTVAECISGCICNLHFHMKIWDYSRMPLNFKGQVCLLYTVLWGILSIPASVVYQRLEKTLRFGRTKSCKRARVTTGRTCRTGISAE